MIVETGGNEAVQRLAGEGEADEMRADLLASNDFHVTHAQLVTDPLHAALGGGLGHAGSLALWLIISTIIRITS
ncbi:hypothetical protein D9M72_635800 [compost metagenome]